VELLKGAYDMEPRVVSVYVVCIDRELAMEQYGLYVWVEMVFILRP